MREAQLASRRAQRAKVRGSATAHGGAAYIAIIASCTATEIYLSEIVAHLLEAGLLNKAERDAIKAEENLWRKFNLLLQTLRRPSVHTTSLYSQYVGLVTLRNCLVHRSAEFLLPGTWPKSLQKRRNVIPYVKGDGLDWTSQVLDAETAAWAVGTAREWLRVMRSEIADPADFARAIERRTGKTSGP